MNKEQFLLMKLAEECTEVGKRAIKQMQYGSKQIWKGGEVVEGIGPTADEGTTNAMRLQTELQDLAIIVDLIRESGFIDEKFGEEPWEEYEQRKADKVAKINKYLAFSRSLGMIDGDWTV